MILQPVIDIVAKHLAAQNAQSTVIESDDDDIDSQCRYRLERDGTVLMCAVGVLLDGYVDVKELEGLPASDIYQDTTFGFSTALAAIHETAMGRLNELKPLDMDSSDFGRYLDAIQSYHDADGNYTTQWSGSRYIDVLALNLTEEEREVRIRADLKKRMKEVTSQIQRSKDLMI